MKILQSSQQSLFSYVVASCQPVVGLLLQILQYNVLLCWKAKLLSDRRKYCHVRNLSGAIKENEELDERLKTSITEHLQSLENEFKRYFTELKEQEAAFVRSPFSTALDVSDIPDELKDRFYHL